MIKIQPRRVSSGGFSRFGKVVQGPSVEPTAEGPAFKFWSDIANYRIDGETEIGLCTVYAQPDRSVTWMERHERSPELLVPIDAPFVLPVMPEDAGPRSVEAFTVNVGEAVVIGQNVWHSACQPVDSETATYFVIFRRGTPSQDVTKTIFDGTGVEISEVSSS